MLNEKKKQPSMLTKKMDFRQNLKDKKKKRKTSAAAALTNWLKANDMECVVVRQQ